MASTLIAATMERGGVSQRHGLDDRQAQPAHQQPGHRACQGYGPITFTDASVARRAGRWQMFAGGLDKTFT